MKVMPQNDFLGSQEAASLSSHLLQQKCGKMLKNSTLNQRRHFCFFWRGAVFYFKCTMQFWICSGAFPIALFVFYDLIVVCYKPCLFDTILQTHSLFCGPENVGNSYHIRSWQIHPLLEWINWFLKGFVLLWKTLLSIPIFAKQSI